MPGRADPGQTNAALRARLEAAASQIEPPNRARVARMRARLLREVVRARSATAQAGTAVAAFVAALGGRGRR